MNTENGKQPAKKITQKTYFDFAAWLSFNEYKYSIQKQCWIDRNGKEHSPKKLFKEFINDITNTH